MDDSGVVAGGNPPPHNFLGALKSKRIAKLRNCQCEISYKICQVRLVNSSNSGIHLATVFPLFNAALLLTPLSNKLRIWEEKSEINTAL